MICFPMQLAYNHTEPQTVKELASSIFAQKIPQTTQTKPIEKSNIDKTLEVFKDEKKVDDEQ